MVLTKAGCSDGDVAVLDGKQNCSKAAVDKEHFQVVTHRIKSGDHQSRWIEAGTLLQLIRFDYAKDAHVIELSSGENRVVFHQGFDKLCDPYCSSAPFCVNSYQLKLGALLS